MSFEYGLLFIACYASQVACEGEIIRYAFLNYVNVFFKVVYCTFLIFKFEKKSSKFVLFKF